MGVGINTGVKISKSIITFKLHRSGGGGRGFESVGIVKNSKLYNKKPSYRDSTTLYSQ